MEDSPIYTHGGARPGSGPKPKPKEQLRQILSLSLAPDVYAYVSELKGRARTAFVDAAIRAQMPSK